MNWLNKLERKIGRVCIPNLMLYIVIGQAVVYMFNAFVGVAQYLTLDIQMVLAGEVWRLLSFLFVPLETSPIFIIFSLYFYYMVGSNLENAWGSFQFNAYYLISILGTIAGAFITGYGSNIFINLSLFYAFAILFPDFRLMLFFFIPVKIKWIAIANAALYGVVIVVSAVRGDWVTVVAIAASLVSVAVFFTKSFVVKLKHTLSYRKTRTQYRAQQQEWERNRRNNRFDR